MRSIAEILQWIKQLVRQNSFSITDNIIKLKIYVFFVVNYEAISDLVDKTFFCRLNKIIFLQLGNCTVTVTSFI